MRSRLFLMVLALVICSIRTNAQERELRVEKNGFEWYEIYKDGKYGAEDKNGRTLIPCEYNGIYYSGILDGFQKVFNVRRYEDGFHYEGIYTINGRCVIPTNRHYTRVSAWSNKEGNYFEFNKEGIGAGICDINGHEIIFIEGIEMINPVINKGKFYYLLYNCKDHLYGCADGNGKIIFRLSSKFIDRDRCSAIVKTTRNPLKVEEDISINYIDTHTSSGSSPSPSSSSDYEFVFKTYYLANTKIDDDELKVIISKSGVIKVEYGGFSFDFKCERIDISENFMLSQITFYGSDSDDKLEISSTGILFYRHISTPISETIKNQFSSIRKAVLNKKIFSSPVPVSVK